MSLPNVTKEICNGWKSDYHIASVVLHRDIHAIVAQLGGWAEGSRIAQDDVIWKQDNGGTAIGFHQDDPYISRQFVPRLNNSITVWMPLDDVDSENGTIEYVAGSHKIPKAVIPHNFHGKGFDRDIVSDALGLTEFHAVNVPKGGVAFHHQWTWHGSGPNSSSTGRQRRVVVAHTLNASCTFRTDKPVGYIYGRYVQKEQPAAVNESFYPICSGPKQTLWLNDYIPKNLDFSICTTEGS
eukprot:PhF_6_TR1492/c0_g1_i1/m.2696